MIDVRELRVGNRLLKDGIVVTIDARSIFDIWDKSEQYSPIPLTVAELDNIKEFERRKHLVLSSLYQVKLGRKRYLSVSECATPNEMWFVAEQDGKEVKDLISVRNYDYDKTSYLHQLQNLYYSLTGQELQFKS